MGSTSYFLKPRYLYRFRKSRSALKHNKCILNGRMSYRVHKFDNSLPTDRYVISNSNSIHWQAAKINRKSFLMDKKRNLFGGSSYV